MGRGGRILGSLGACAAGLGLAVSSVADFLNLPKWAQYVSGASGLLIVGGVVGYHVGQWGSEPAKKADANRAQKDRARRLVQYLHRRWFPSSSGAGAGLDAGYRVSLFVPEPTIEAPEKWVCYARTSMKKPAAEWKHVTDAEELETAGIVVLAAVDQRDLDIPGLTGAQLKSATALKTYRDATCLSEKLHNERSWKGATMAVRVARAQNGPIFCIMVVEREDGQPIEVKAHKLLTHATPGVAAPAVLRDICGVELQLAADIWAASWDRT